MITVSLPGLASESIKEAEKKYSHFVALRRLTVSGCLIFQYALEGNTDVFSIRVFSSGAKQNTTEHYHKSEPGK